MTTAPTDGWYYGIATNKTGPITRDELVRLLQAKQLGAQTLVWHASMANWVPASAVSHLGAPRDDGGALNLLIPMGPQSGLAIAAGYCGILAFIPLAGLVGVILGSFAVRDLKRHPEKRGWGRALTGIILGSLASVLYAYFMFRTTTPRS